MESPDIRKRFLDFFRERGHAVVSSSSLIPADPSVLLTTAGMQQFKPYYTGEADPIRDFDSRNTASVQKSFRTSDIDEVGDESHLTFFEMLGNFSFGGYFKEEAIRHAFDFFRSVNLPIQYVTVFEGDAEVPADEESERIWRELGISDVSRRGRIDNFWGPTGAEGPCGPTTEIYARDVEIWNIVFNQYYCRPNRTLEPLKQSGVDTGMGLERLAMVLQDKATIFETDLFAPCIALLPAELPVRIQRIIADHTRAIAFLISDGVRSSNKGAGYVLRRLLRRILVYEKLYRLPEHLMDSLFREVVHQYGEAYPELMAGSISIRNETAAEREKFLKTMERGIKELEKIPALDAPAAFKLYESYGLPFEILKELGGEKAKELNREAFDEEFVRHQEISRAGQEKKFGGHGLILDTGELKAGSEEELQIVTRLHTATHLLNAALHKVLGEAVSQRGSDITAERTRFDFSFPRKLTTEEIAKIEGLVNYAIQKDFPVTIKEMPLEEAKRAGALYFYKGQYPERVKVYTIGNEEAEIFSRELCGGPHVSRTGEIGAFKIAKEESSSAGIRRIRARIENLEAGK
ncbi:MAG: alanine--tRNA ligase [Candidatus Sungbacteria bacterium]|nr:alanine--tRNA ligase [Candidatus Sungbacteria bacterium]